MTSIPPLDPAQLLRACDPGQFAFATTTELDDLTEIIGQVRAMDALRFGAGIRREGYNLFVLGPPGMGKRTLVRQFLAAQTSQTHESPDWCYVNNFTETHRPIAMRLPPGRGVELRHHMEKLIEFLRAAIPSAYEGEDYRAKADAIQNEYNTREEGLIQALGEEAEKDAIVLLRTPEGFAFAPTRDDKAIPKEEYEKLPEATREQIESKIAQLQARLEDILKQVPQWRRERAERLQKLNRDTLLSVVEAVMTELRGRYSDLPAVLDYLDAVQRDLITHADDFHKQEESDEPDFHAYQVNVLVSNGRNTGLPIVSEDNPNYGNLVGRVEHYSQMGVLVTDYTLIKAGALHHANGGYLLLDAHKVLAQPFAWEGLKRALQSAEIRIESLGQIYSLISTVSLEPAPIPLDVKIILFGDRMLYYLLLELDADFAELFKVAADFEDHIERSPETHLLYARLIATLCRKEELLPLERAAVARVIDHGARLVGDAERLTAHMRSIADLLREADYWAREAGQTVVKSDDVTRAIEAKEHRHDRVQKLMEEDILRGTQLIATDGAVTGQVNGLTVIEMGDTAFAQPARITATTRLGDGELINIEREVDLSGAIHSKGVLILSAFLAARYARNQPLSLSASLAFEQSYGYVEGDSASLAELCALLSDLAAAPIRQSLAVTGSVNQLGQVQAIGAVNEKIEGFFDICQARGLTGEQGVLIPAANARHLMLRRAVVEAAAAGRFHIYAVDSVDQALTLLTGVEAGAQDVSGGFALDTINYRVMMRLAELTAIGIAMARQNGKRHKGRK